MNELNPIYNVSRRGFLGQLFAAGSLVLTTRLPLRAASGPWQPSVYVGLDATGVVSIIAHRSEMGTGIRTALPMVLADELDADWKRVKIVQAIGDTKYGSQNTDGSCSIRDFYDSVRQAGATTRLMLERAAAQKWGVPAGECKAANHEVTHAKSGKRGGYGEFVEIASSLAVPKPEELKYKSPAEFKYIGKSAPIVDQHDIVSGKGTFGMDAKVPGMVFASIARSPVLGGKVKSVDDSGAKAVKGVQQVVTIDPYKPPHFFQALGGVAVIADSTWSAMQGRKKLKVDWESSPNAALESEAFKKEMAEKARKPQKVVRNVGNVDAEFAKGGATHEADYYAPMLSHVPMEPPVAVAEYKDGKVTAWAPTQNPQAVQEAVAQSMGLQPKDVICHVTLLGGGFGRKSKPDYVCEAALLSKKIGKPVKVVWSREEDIQHDFYHVPAAMYFKAALDAKGKPTAWLHRSVFPTIGSTFAAGAEYGMDLELAMGLTDLPYDIPHHRAENGPAKSHVRTGWMRAVANVYHAFGVHSFVDELAAKANRDRVEYLLDVIGPARKLNLEKYWNNGQPLEKFPWDTGRLRNVLELAAEKSGWAKKKSGKGRGWGVAVHRSFLSYIAVVAEVEVDKAGNLKIPRVDIAADCGQIIHPDRVKSQFEGAVVFGTSIARFGEVTATGGKINQSNFHDYPVARIHEAPREIHVHLVPSSEAPAGVGEPGVPPTPPAICNAIFAATGKRIRELPLSKHKLA
jgi:isoquinoline 1-oxidoreductase beta subunit